MTTLTAFTHTNELPALNDFTETWFSRGTMDFFGSRTYGSIHHGRYFITSEQPPYGKRAYTIRFVNETDRIDTVGEMCQYGTYTAAWKALDKMVNAGELPSYGPAVIDNR